MYNTMTVSKVVQDVYVASTRCPICNYKRPVVNATTIYCPIHGYMDRVFVKAASKEVKH